MFFIIRRRGGLASWICGCMIIHNYSGIFSWMIQTLQYYIYNTNRRRRKLLWGCSHVPHEEVAEGKFTIHIILEKVFFNVNFRRIWNKYYYSEINLFWHYCQDEKYFCLTKSLNMSVADHWFLIVHHYHSSVPILKNKRNNAEYEWTWKLNKKIMLC